MFRVFVGTLYSGEGDIDECLAAIKKQAGVQVTHRVISDLPEREAHNELWRAWRSVQYTGFDFFVKIDADTVMTSDIALKTIGEQFQRADVTGIQCPLHDFYSDSLINGMNCFSPSVSFLETTDDLYCDRVDVGHKRVLRGSSLPDILNPVGKHCWFSQNIHSFHFGLHRMMKNQHETLRKVRIAYAKDRDPRRAFALLGAMAAKTWDPSWGFSYADEAFQREYSNVVSRFDELVKNL